MPDPLLRDALRLIQDIVIETKGSALDREAVRRVEAVLKRLAGMDQPAAADPGFSERDATVLFADLRGFTAISASYPAEVVLGTLSRCFGLLTEIVLRHYGTIDKFLGDGIMVVFYGDNVRSRDHAQRALLCAVEMQIAMNELRQLHRGDRLPEIYIGIGISSGKVMTGIIGSDAYRAFTAIGDDVNLAVCAGPRDREIPRRHLVRRPAQQSESSRARGDPQRPACSVRTTIIREFRRPPYRSERGCGGRRGRARRQS